jgi:4-hydroxythreonine-4-phosphate dehydrogenase
MSAVGRIVLGLTLGDPAGIGPEVMVKAAFDSTLNPAWVRVLIGSPLLIRHWCRRLHHPLPPAWQPGSGLALASVVQWDPGPVLDAFPPPGQCRAAGARAAVSWIRAAVQAGLAGELHGMVTGPINKAGLHRAGVDYPGHTEMLADWMGARQVGMLLMGGGLRVVLATRHLPLAEVARRLKGESIEEAAVLLSQGLQWMGVRKQEIAIAALNPHGGDQGVLGREEQTVIEPAIRRLKRAGYSVVGPIPADVLFYQARRGRYGGVVAMYHDQGLGPLKMLAFDSGINITLGLPLVRTSPDHGTAYDIAGRGVASARSALMAVRLAGRLARRPNPWRTDTQRPAEPRI